MLLAQTLEVFLAAESGDAALVIVKQRRAKYISTKKRVPNSSRRSHVLLAFGQDFVKGFAGPTKRVCVKVPFPNKRIQAFSQMFLVYEIDDAESLALQNAKPLFHLVHPRAMHGRV